MAFKVAVEGKERARSGLIHWPLFSHMGQPNHIGRWEIQSVHVPTEGKMEWNLVSMSRSLLFAIIICSFH